MPSLFKKLLQHKEEDPFHGRKDLVFLKHFNFVKALGSGTYAHVYHVRRVDDGRDYALKATDLRHLSKNERRSLVEEVRYLASLNHPNIVRYYEAFVEEEWLCIITELVLGGDLGTLIRKTDDSNTYLSEKRVWSILIQTALALEELHNCKLLHRDVKPANLLLKNGTVVKLADFGISRILERVFTRTQIGTPGYMSPEMWLGRPYSLSSDVWALGCVALETAILRPAFPGNTESEIKAAVVNGRTPLLPRRYSDDLNDVISAMLMRDPIKRPTIAEVLAMPQVKRHWGDLPADLTEQLAKHVQSAPAHHILKPIAIPEHLEQLNNLLPPAQYESGGGGVALYLARPLSSSTGDLVALGESSAPKPKTPGSHTEPGMGRSSSHDGGFQLVEPGADSFAAWPNDYGSAEAVRRLRRKSVQVADAMRLRRRAEVCGEDGEGDDMLCAFQRGDDWWKRHVAERAAHEGKPPSPDLGSASGAMTAPDLPPPSHKPMTKTASSSDTSDSSGPAPATASKVRFSADTDDTPAPLSRRPLTTMRTASESRLPRNADVRRTSVMLADVDGHRTRPHAKVELMSAIMRPESFSSPAARHRFELCPIARNSFLVPSTTSFNAAAAKSMLPANGLGSAATPTGVKPGAPRNPPAQPAAAANTSVPVRSAVPAMAPSPFAPASAPPQAKQDSKKSKSGKGNFFKRIFK